MDLLVKLGLAVAVLGGVWYSVRRLNAGLTSLGSAASDAAGYVAETANNVVSSPVFAAGDAVGIPRTSPNQCAIDKANGDTWAASFSCPAGEFIDYVTSPSPPRNTGGASGSW